MTFPPESLKRLKSGCSNKTGLSGYPFHIPLMTSLSGQVIPVSEGNQATRQKSYVVMLVICPVLLFC